MKKEISVVILTAQGPRHSYFCYELAKHYSIRGVVVDDRYHWGDRLWTLLKINGFHPARIFRSFLLKKQSAPYEERDRKTEEKFFPPPTHEFPVGIPILRSRDPNDEKTISWIQKLSPEVIVVFGTRLLREPVLRLARFGALNLHTGLSPFYRGGQCTFWCLDEGDLDHLGVTVHHLSQKIDGGDIVYTAQPEVEPGDTVRSLECKLVRLGADLMIRAVSEIREGTAPRVTQRGKGKLFLSKMFTLEKRLELEKKLEEGWITKLLEGRGAPAVVEPRYEEKN